MALFVKHCTKNWVLKVFVIEGGTGNYDFIIKSDITISTLFRLNIYLFLNDPPNVPFIKTERSAFRPLSWNQLDPNIQNSSSIEFLKRALLKFIRTKPALTYKIHHARGLKLLTKLHLGLSNMREHKFKHNCNVTIDPFSRCGTNDLETSEHSFCVALIMHTCVLNSLTIFEIITYYFYCYLITHGIQINHHLTCKSRSIL